MTLNSCAVCLCKTHTSTNTDCLFRPTHWPLRAWSAVKMGWQVGESLIVNATHWASSIGNKIRPAEAALSEDGLYFIHCTTSVHQCLPRADMGQECLGKLWGGSKLEHLEQPSVKFVVICALQFKNLFLVCAWGYKVENPAECSHTLTQDCNWQLWEVLLTDCQIDTHVTTCGILGIQRLAFPPVAIIHFAPGSSQEIHCMSGIRSFNLDQVTL